MHDRPPSPPSGGGGLLGGQRICVRCAGASALYTARDLSGQPVERVTIEDVRAWPDDLGPLECEAHCTKLTALAGPDGWPLAKGGAR